MTIRVVRHHSIQDECTELHYSPYSASRQYLMWGIYPQEQHTRFLARFYFSGSSTNHKSGINQPWWRRQDYAIKAFRNKARTRKIFYQIIQNYKIWNGYVYMITRGACVWIYTYLSTWVKLYMYFFFDTWGIIKTFIRSCLRFHRHALLRYKLGWEASSAPKRPPPPTLTYMTLAKRWII